MNKDLPVESISKTIYNVTKNLKLKLQVKFGSKDQQGDRKDPLFVNSYTSKNYNNDIDVISMNIDTNDYLVLDYKEYNGTNISIYISYPHLFNMKRFLKKCVSWFYDEEYSDMYIYKKDDIKLNVKYKEMNEYTDYTIERKMIRIKPAVVERNDLHMEGVIMNLDDEVLISLSIDELESLYDTINTFDLFQNSLIITSYYLTSKPDSLLSARIIENRPSSYNNKDVFKKKHVRSASKKSKS